MSAVKINNPFRSPLNVSSAGLGGGQSSSGGGGANDNQPQSGGWLSYLLGGARPTRKVLVSAWVIFVGTLAFTNWLFSDSASMSDRDTGPIVGGFSTTGGLLRDEAQND